MKKCKKKMSKGNFLNFSLPEEITKLYKQQEDELVKVLNLNDQEDLKKQKPMTIKPTVLSLHPSEDET